MTRKRTREPAHRYTEAENNAATGLIRRWLRTETEALPIGTGEPSMELYRAFAFWANRQGRWADVPEPAKWGRILTDLGFPPKKTAKNNIRPIGLLATRRRLEEEDAARAAATAAGFESDGSP